MQNVLIIFLIVVGALASCCSAGNISEQELEALGLSYEQKFMSIVSELNKDDKWKTLAGFVGKLQSITKKHLLDWEVNQVPFEDLIEALRGPKGAEQLGKHEEQHQLRAVLNDCQQVYGRLQESAEGVRIFDRSPDKMDELTKKWLINYTVCFMLVAPQYGVGYKIEDTWIMSIRRNDSSMATFADYLESLPEQVALRRSAMIHDDLVTEKVVEFIDNCMRLPPDSVILTKKGGARLQRFKQLLDRLRKSCKQITLDFEPYLWMVDAGAQLNETDKSLYARQVLALKVARVCERLPSIDFEEPIRQWNSKLSLVKEPIRQRNSKTSLVNSIKKALACGSRPQTTE